MMRSIFRQAFLMVALAGALTGCGTTPVDDATGSGDTGAEDLKQTFNRTIVKRNPDGTEQTTTVTITRAQQLQDIAARESSREGTSAPGNGVGESQQEIGIDGRCSGSSMWMYDQPNYSGNEICFYGAGQAELQFYFRTWQYVNSGGVLVPFPVFWNAAVRSYWAGVESGLFAGPCLASGGGFCQHDSYFNPFQALRSADYYVASAYTLVLN